MGQLTFTADAEKLAVDYPMIAMDLSSGSMISGVGHRLMIDPGTATVEAARIYNAGNGKQITGFKLTGMSTGFTKAGSRILRGTMPEGTALVMNEGTPTQPNTVSVRGGLDITGYSPQQKANITVELPNTPVEVVAPTV